ncbi:hypothetical protein THRCLA_06336 [Thraustotheca clavata]|uniref:Uncharacterized protein n=1 Tax=Thraustotheca clavata TaxID=74557 RepID=A0A1V9ZQ64_9STRA|nr:hypothetical protein THRCLA_06336 [Thraustotheca clavata]
MAMWWHMAVVATSIVALSYVLYKATAEPLHVQQKRKALELLEQVQGIVDTIRVKLDALEEDVKQFLQSQNEQEDQQDDETPLNSYYHFDSTGKKLKTKWDSFDVDAELERLDDEQNTSSSTSPKKKNTFTKSQLEQRAGGLEFEFEAVLGYLDSSIRGDDDVRIVRKQIVGAINDIHLKRIDNLRTKLNTE